MNLKIVAALLQVGTVLAAAGLLGPTRPRLLSAPNVIDSLSQPLELLSEASLDTPMRMADLTPIVQSVVQSAGLTIESQDSGLNAVEFRLSKPPGRSLNLMFSQDGNEVMHVTLKSDTDEQLGETQFSTLGANRAEVSSLLEHTLESSGQTARQLNEQEPIDWKLLTEKVFDDAEVTQTWNVDKFEEQKEAVLTLKGATNSKKLLVSLREYDKKGSIFFDDSQKGKLMSVDHHRAVIFFSNPNFSERLVAQIKEKLAVFRDNHSIASAVSAKAGAVSEYIKTLFPDHEVMELPTADAARKMLVVRTKDAQKPVSLGSVYIVELNEEFLQIVLSMFSKVHTLFMRADRFDERREWVRSEVSALMASQPPMLATPSAIASLIQKKMNSLCPEEPKVAFQSQTDTAFVFASTSKDDEKACLFARSDILLSFNHYNLYGRLDQMLVAVVNPYLQTESIFRPDPQHTEQSISDFVLNLFAELNDAKVFAENPAEDGSLSVEKAEELLEAKQFKKDEGDIFQFENENGKVAIRVRDADELLSVEATVKQATTSPEKWVTRSQQFFIPKASKADEQKRFNALIEAEKMEVGAK